MSKRKIIKRSSKKVFRDDDIKFMRRAIAQARKCKHEGAPGDHPFVGAVVVMNGRELAQGYRSEKELGDHAEITVLKKKLPDTNLVGATVYTTLEPCTKRELPNIPCAEILSERKVGRVVIGMIDPNQTITGKGIRKLRDVGIAVDLFPPKLMAELEVLNSHFTRSQSKKGVNATFFTGLPAIVKLIEKRCLKADTHIRFLLHALSSEYKIPDKVAEKLAKKMQQRERKGRPLEFWPVIVADTSIPTNDLLEALSRRRALYDAHGVHKFIQPRFLDTDVPFGIDILLIDTSHALFCITTALGSAQAQIGLLVEDRPEFVSQMVAWFDKILRAKSLTFQQFLDSRRPIDSLKTATL